MSQVKGAEASPLYARLKISYAGAEPGDLTKLHTSKRRLIAAGGDDIWLHLDSFVDDCNNLALRYYLIEDHRAALRYGREVVPAATAYLLGDWRKRVKTDLGTIDPKWWYAREAWMDSFRYALCWGSVFGQWSQLKRLAQYPNPQRNEERSGINKKPALRQFLHDAASYLRGGKFRSALGRGRSAKKVGKLVGAKWRGMAAHAAALDAVADRDNDDATAAINAALRAIRNARATRDITEMLALEATFLCNLAAHEGLTPRVDPSLEMYLIRPRFPQARRK